MSNLGRVIGAFGLALLIGAASAAAQVSTIKDGWLVMKVHSEMVDEDVLSGSDIDVDVKNGVVTLQGTVPSEAARARAIAVAKANDGVKNVVDQLKIAPARGSNMAAKADRAEDKAARAGEKAERAAERAGEKAERAGERAADKTESAARKTGRAIDDGWIKSKIYAQYMADWNTVLNDSNIDVDVENNIVTLNGTVKSAEAKAKAVSTAKATDGVKGVRDNLKVAAGATR
jgi:osmotically-inducible protein OsmY